MFCGFDLGISFAFLKTSITCSHLDIKGLMCIYVYKPKKCLLTFQKCCLLGLPSQWTVNENFSVFPVSSSQIPQQDVAGCRVRIMAFCSGRAWCPCPSWNDHWHWGEVTHIMGSPRVVGRQFAGLSLLPEVRQVWDREGELCSRTAFPC